MGRKAVISCAMHKLSDAAGTRSLATFSKRLKRRHHVDRRRLRQSLVHGWRGRLCATNPVGEDDELVPDDGGHRLDEQPDEG